jgi:hypothetical protein
MMLTDMLLRHQYDAYQSSAPTNSLAGIVSSSTAVSRMDLQLVEQEYYYNHCLMLQNQQELLQLEQQQRVQLEEKIQNQQEEYRRRVLQALQQSCWQTDVAMNADSDSSSHEDDDTDSNDDDSKVSFKSEHESIPTKKNFHSLGHQGSDRPTKRVRFSSEDPIINDNTAAHPQDRVVIIPGRQDYVEENLIDQLWWDEKTINSNRLEQKRLGDVHNKRNDPTYHDSIIFLTKTFPSDDDNDAVDHCNDLESNGNVLELRRTLLKHLKTIINADVRGLEQRSVSALRLQRRLASQSVLSLQQQIRQTNRTFQKQQEEQQVRVAPLRHHSSLDATTSPCSERHVVSPPPVSNEKMTKLLRRRSLQASRRSRQLAFRLAQADRLIASKIHSEKSR